MDTYLAPEVIEIEAALALTPASDLRDEHVQNLLVASHRASSALEARWEGLDLEERRRLWREREVRRRHTQALVESCLGLALGKLLVESRKRMGEDWVRENATDLRSEAAEFVLSCAARFDVTITGSFAAFVASNSSNFVSGVLRASGRAGAVPQGWERVLRMVGGIQAEHKDRKLSRTELVGMLESRCRTWAEEHLGASERELTGEAREAALERKMSKQGMTSALKDIDKILAVVRGDVRLDATVGDGSTCVGEIVGMVDRDGVEGEVFTQGAEEALDRLYAVALGDSADEMRARMADSYGLLAALEGEGAREFEDADAEGAGTKMGKAEKARARARLLAPHAQFAHLAPALEVVFEEPSGSVLAFARSLDRMSFADF
jgi:hypothetical protein